MQIPSIKNDAIQRTRLCQFLLIGFYKAVHILSSTTVDDTRELVLLVLQEPPCQLMLGKALEVLLTASSKLVAGHRV